MNPRKKVGVGHADVTELEKRYVNDCLDHSRLSQGDYVAKFESGFAKAHGKKFGIMCSSGTAALHLALECLKETDGWKPGDEILVPAITFIATPNSCIHAGLKPVFVDVDPKSYNIDPSRIEERITKRTRAIIPVHCFGLPCEMDEIVRIAEENDLRIIEDCAESHFARYRKASVGSFGDFACFSTYVAHTITTGVGGLVLTDELKHAEVVRSLLAHGRACSCMRCVASDPTKVCPIRFDENADKRFTFVRIGYSYRVGEIEGALGLAQFERREEIMKKRRENAYYLNEVLADLSDFLQLPTHPDYVKPSFMMYPIVVKDRVDRGELIGHLEKNNIETRPMLPVLNQPAYKELYGDMEDEYPVAKRIDQNGFYIGCHHGLDRSILGYVSKIIHDFFENGTNKG